MQKVLDKARQVGYKVGQRSAVNGERLRKKVLDKRTRVGYKPCKSTPQDGEPTMVKFESRFTTMDDAGKEYDHLQRITFIGARKVTRRWCKFASENKWLYTARYIERATEWGKSWDACHNWQVENFTPVKGARMSDKPCNVKDYTK